MAELKPISELLNDRLLSSPYTSPADLQTAINSEANRYNASVTGQKMADAVGGIVNEVKGAFSGVGNKTLAYVVVALVAVVLLKD